MTNNSHFSQRLIYFLPNHISIHDGVVGDSVQQKYLFGALKKIFPNLQVFFVDSDECIYEYTQIKGFVKQCLSWSDSWWFVLFRKFVGRIQSSLGLPYFSFFVNLRLIDFFGSYIRKTDIIFQRNGLYRFGFSYIASKKNDSGKILFFDADPIYELDFSGTPLKGILRYWARLCINFNLRKSDKIICVSNVIKRQLISAWDVPDKKVFVLHNAVDTDLFRPDNEQREICRRTWGLKDKKVVLYVGSFCKWHDVQGLIQAFAKVRSLHSDALLILVGDGDNRKACEDLCSRLAIDSCVRFQGARPQSEIQKFINAADVCVAPYPKMKDDFWGSPMKIYEYMACGAAVISSRVGQISETIKQGFSGLLTEPGDIDDLARQMEVLLCDSELRSRLGKNARAVCVQQYSLGKFAEELECILLS